MSSEDHPDWWRPMGGQNSQDSILERRSLIWNDDGVVDRTTYPIKSSDEAYRGKFFTRGCRGKIEEIQIYCRGAVADGIRLRYSPNPCLGPIWAVTITPGAAWGWVSVAVEEMWNYDSLFIWIQWVKAGVEWAYDEAQPYDGHESDDVGATWADMAIRPFIRVVYTGETPGDVPVSGIVNTIKIPNSASALWAGIKAIAAGVETDLVDLAGVGYCDFILFNVTAAAGSDMTYLRVYCDERGAFNYPFASLSGYGFLPSTPSLSLLRHAADGDCTMLITRKFEFRQRLRVTALNPGDPVNVQVDVYPTMLR